MSGRYRTIVADPPWPIGDFPQWFAGDKEGTVARPYPTYGPVRWEDAWPAQKRVLEEMARAALAALEVHRRSVSRSVGWGLGVAASSGKESER